MISAQTTHKSKKRQDRFKIRKYQKIESDNPYKILDLSITSNNEA